MMDVESVGADYEFEEEDDGAHPRALDEDEGRANLADSHQTRGGAAAAGQLENTVWNAADVTEYDEQTRPHAGTGGSSKMRSRPNQFNQLPQNASI